MSKLKNLVFLVLFFGLAAMSGKLEAQCPAYGADSTCGTVITISNSGASVSFTGQGPYDGNDDTLVGVVNMTKTPITSLTLQSGLGIFGFDGDGVDTYGAPGNSMDNTGYGGPNSYFTNISSDTTTGTVNFIAPLTQGQTTYFSLENALTSANNVCADIINNSVPSPTLTGISASGKPLNIVFTFTPNFGYSLTQAAQVCGFAGFDWKQTFKNLPDPSPFCAVGASATNPQPFCNQTLLNKGPYPTHLTSKSTPFNDPPPNGYTYKGFFNSFPFYYPSASILNDVANLPSPPTFCAETLNGACILTAVDPSGQTLSLFDSPRNPCFAGGVLVNTPTCGNTSVPAPLSLLAFTTHLAGINSDGTPTDLGIGYDWTDTFNGNGIGGISVLGTTIPSDPASGTGGITITAGNGTTSYVYPKFAVTAINGVTTTPPTSAVLLTGSQLSVTASGLSYSRVTKLFTGTVTIKNLSNAALSGPFQVVLNSLPSGVTLVNATNIFGGYPFVAIPNIGTLAPGASATVTLQLSNPSSSAIAIYPLVYTGSFN